MGIINGNSKKVPSEFVMYKLSEKFGWTEKQILETSYKYITSILKIIRIENDYRKWKIEKDGNK